MSVIPNVLMEHDRRIIDTAVELIDGCFEKDTIINALHESLATDFDFINADIFSDPLPKWYEDINRSREDETFAMNYILGYTDIVVFEHLNNDRILVGA